MNAMQPPQSIEEIKAGLETTEKGGVRQSIRNCLTVFQRDPLLSGAIAYNILTDRKDIIKPIGFHRESTALNDTDMKYLLLYLEETYGLTNEKKIDNTTAVAEEPVQVVEEAEPTEKEKIPFTIAGNGEVEDNMMDDPSKEFFTVKTKGGNTFFLVIDRARNSENVYMLSMIDEYDLQEFLDDEERNGKQEEETPAVVLPETKPEPTPDVEIEEPKEESSGGMNKILLLVFVVALGGAGAFFYFYIYKPKPKEETPQSENLETDQSLATVNEDSQQE